MQALKQQYAALEGAACFRHILVTSVKHMQWNIVLRDCWLRWVHEFSEVHESSGSSATQRHKKLDPEAYANGFLLDFVVWCNEQSLRNEATESLKRRAEMDYPVSAETQVERSVDDRSSKSKMWSLSWVTYVCAEAKNVF